MGGKSKAPDPVATSTAQANSNQSNNLNPFTTSTWKQTGTNPDGTPIRTQTTTLSPQLQGLYDQVGKTNPNLSSESLGAQFDKSQGAAYDKSMSYYQPQFDVQNRELESKLAEQGITQGSAGYDTAHQLQSNQQAFQRQQAMDSSYMTGLAGEGQQFSQGVQQSNLPISQLSTLFSLGGGAGQGNSNTLAQLAQSKYQTDTASQNNMDSGLLSAAAMAAMYYFSDERMKTDVRLAARRPDGIGVYTYRYAWDRPDAPPRIGVLAQEVEQVMPHAVRDGGAGFKAVNYAAL